MTSRREDLRARQELITAELASGDRKAKYQSVEEYKTANDNSLDKSLQYAEDSTTKGIQALTGLRVQREQLKSIRQDLKETDETLSTAEYLIRGMKSVPGAFFNLFLAKPSTPSANHKHSSQQGVSSPYSTPCYHNTGSTPKPSSLTSDAHPSQQSTTTNDVDQNRLQQLLLSVTNTHKLAGQINSELKSQESLLEDIDSNIDKNSSRIKNVNAEMREMLR